MPCEILTPSTVNLNLSFKQTLCYSGALKSYHNTKSLRTVLLVKDYASFYHHASQFPGPQQAMPGHITGQIRGIPNSLQLQRMINHTMLSSLTGQNQKAGPGVSSEIIHMEL